MCLLSGRRYGGAQQSEAPLGRAGRARPLLPWAAMDAPARYLDELRSELGLYPTWFPGDPVEVGAFGRIVRGRFVADGRLRDRGIEVKVRRHEQKSSFKKQRGMTLTAGAGALAQGGAIDAEAGIDFAVGSAYAWAFAARGMSKAELDNVLEVEAGVLEAQRLGDWRRWLVVSEVRHVELLNVIVARSRQARFRVRARGALAEPLDVLLQEDARFEQASDDVFTVRGARGATPLYGLRKLQGVFSPELSAFGKDPKDAPLELRLAPALDEPFFSEADTSP